MARRVLVAVGMQFVRKLSALNMALVDVQRAWVEPLELSGMRAHHHDVIHHVCLASSYDHPLLTREAYLSLLGLGDCLHLADESGLDPVVSTNAWRCIDALLDEIEPSVSRADIALRHARGETLEETLARIFKDGQ